LIPGGPRERAFQKGQSGNPRGKSLPTSLAGALNEPIYATINRRGRNITKGAGPGSTRFRPDGPDPTIRGDSARFLIGGAHLLLVLPAGRAAHSSIVANCRLA
jgi:hypothetical protein